MNANLMHIIVLTCCAISLSLQAGKKPKTTPQQIKKKQENLNDVFNTFEKKAQEENKNHQDQKELGDLFILIYQNKLSKIKKLLQKNPSLLNKERDVKPITPLEYAFLFDKLEIANYLLTCKDIDCMKGTIWCDIAKSNNIDVIKNVLKLNINVNKKNKSCCLSMLDHVIHYCSEEIVDLYLEQKDIAFESYELVSAIDGNKSSIVSKILKHPNFQPSIPILETSLNRALSKERYEIAPLIQKKLANLKKQQEDENYQTILNKPLYSQRLKRVQRWYDDAKTAYEEHCQEYKKIANDKDYELMVKFHTFSDAVDHFVKLYGASCILNKDTEEESISHNSAGQIIYRNENNEKIIIDGVFSYAINMNGELYHKCFSQTIFEPIEHHIKDTLEDSKIENKVSLTTSSQDIKKLIKLKPLSLEGYENCVWENKLYVEINDNNNDMIIRLFKTK